MCFTVKQTAKAKKLAEKYGRTAQAYDDAVREASERLSAFAHPRLAVVTHEAVRPMRWGLVPHWIRTRDEALAIQDKTPNAKGETAFDKPSFRDSIRVRRCVIPVDAFYEWQHVGKEKRPHVVMPAGDEFLALAGIWDTWLSPQTSTAVETFSILTCAANPTMAVIHNTKLRMPVILDPKVVDAWLDPALSEDGTRALLVPCPDDWLRTERLLLV